MKIACLDLEGVLVPEIWIAFSRATGIDELKLTTREISDYSALMDYRMKILDEKGLSLDAIQDVIATIKPLEGARQFLEALRERTQVLILSDTFEEFAKPLMRQLDWPTIWCNSLVLDERRFIRGIRMRTQNGKFKSVKALRELGFEVFATGDSYNDLAMIKEADASCLFCSPEKIIRENPDLPHALTYTDLLKRIDDFLER
ncbi:MAG: bifunctional phosphoserine phosphatase/homoserine phosphotransferase ThrH [Sphaerochaetaceae bacterium]|jgi:phosphoserine/homoserine phosphotransferase|nr:bifunctional phosphoserine phosphatase/homoserine phosphotransferase ThrH [Sphaerochaetaceae bacterium]